MDDKNIFHSSRFWVMVFTCILVLGVSGLAIASGQTVDEKFVVSIIGAVSAAFIIGKSISR